MICGIKPQTLTSNELKECLKKAIACNRMLQSKAKALGMNYNEFREKFFAEDLDNNKTLCVQLTSAEQSLLNDMLGEVVPQLMAHYCRLAKRVARRYHHLSYLFDVEEEACGRGLLAGIYGYTRPKKSKCSTFIGNVIRNRIIDCERTHSKDGSQRTRKMLQEIEKYRASLADPITFDEACCRKGVTNKDYTKLVGARRKVISHSQLHDEDDNADFSGFYHDFRVDPEWQTAVDNAGLSPLERQVLEGIMSSHRGNDWGLKSRIAEGIINSRTGKPISSQAVAFAIERINEKIQRASHNMRITRQAG